MRIVCWFSCGAASAVATKLAISKNKGNEIVIVRCVVREEHQDNDRFANDCEKWFGISITNLIAEEYNGSVFEVIQRRKYVSGVNGAPCTMLLKKQVRERFQRSDDVHVFGYCAEEYERYNSFLDANNIKTQAPLIDLGLKHSDCFGMLVNAGIELPKMYKLGYQHNNCIGCVKATGAGYWNKIKKDFPEMFWRMAGASHALGARMVKVDNERIFLHELKQGVGNYSDEPEIQCGIFCHIAEQEYASS